MTERPSTNREAFSEQTVITFLPWKHLILTEGKKAGLFFYGDANVIFVQLKSKFLVPLIYLIRKVSAAYYLLSFLLVFLYFLPPLETSFTFWYILLLHGQPRTSAQSSAPFALIEKVSTFYIRLVHNLNFGFESFFLTGEGIKIKNKMRRSHQNNEALLAPI